MHRLADFSSRPNIGTVRRDMLASVIVFLVALPLCLGIARACGMPPAAGLLTGIIGGLVVGLICGSPLQVSGPAAGLIVLVAMLVRDQGPAALAVVLVLAGIIQIAAGFLKLGQWFRAVSPAVIEGMLAGIGLLIFAGQFHLMIDDVKRSDGLADMLAIPVSVGKMFHPGGGVYHLAGLIATVTIAVLVIWKLAVPKKWQIFPAPLVAV